MQKLSNSASFPLRAPLAPINCSPGKQTSPKNDPALVTNKLCSNLTLGSALHMIETDPLKRQKMTISGSRNS